MINKILNLYNLTNLYLYLEFVFEMKAVVLYIKFYTFCNECILSTYLPLKAKKMTKLELYN